MNIDSFNLRQTLSLSDFEIFHYKDFYFNTLDFHQHDFYELYFFIDGDVTYCIEEKIHLLKPGDVLMIPPNIKHRPVIDNKSIAYERIVIWIKKNLIYHCLNDSPNIFEGLTNMLDNGTNFLHLNSDNYNFLYKILANIIDCESQMSFYKEYCRSHLSVLFINIYKLCLEKETGSIAKDTIISDIITHINENLSKDISLDYLSKKFFISKYYLLRKFKEYTNITIGNYITAKRINFAKTLLSQGFSAVDTCYQTGFNNYSNFYKAFIKRTMLSPSEYAKKYS